MTGDSTIHDGAFGPVRMGPDTSILSGPASTLRARRDTGLGLPSRVRIDFGIRTRCEPRARRDRGTSGPDNLLFYQSQLRLNFLRKKLFFPSDWPPQSCRTGNLSNPRSSMR